MKLLKITAFALGVWLLLNLTAFITALLFSNALTGFITLGALTAISGYSLYKLITITK
jgi:Na+/H+-dicarboxylate symporter